MEELRDAWSKYRYPSLTKKRKQILDIILKDLKAGMEP